MITPEHPGVLCMVEGYVQVKSLRLVPFKGLSTPVEVGEVLRAGRVRSRLQVAARHPD